MKHSVLSIDLFFHSVCAVLRLLLIVIFNYYNAEFVCQRHFMNNKLNTKLCGATQNKAFQIPNQTNPTAMFGKKNTFNPEQVFVALHFVHFVN